MSLYLRLAWRNIWRHRRRTVIVVLAIGLTMWMMLMYDGLIGGFQQAIYGNAIKVLGGNIQVHAVGYQEKAAQAPLLALPDAPAVVKAALAQPQVVAASQRIITGGLASSREGAFAVSIVGIEPEKELPVSLVGQKVAEGRYLTADDQDLIYIGKGLAVAMGVGVGDRFTLAGRATHEQMRSRTMTVVGIYDIGMADIEKRTVYMSLAEAQDLYGMSGQVTEVVISLKKIGQEPAVINALKPLLPNVEFASWQTSFPELEAAIATKSQGMEIFSYIMLIIVGIGILNLLLMAVFERTREIGVLGAIGLRPGQISLLFLLEGGMMGLVGAAFGVALGLLFNILFSLVGFDFTAFSTITSYTALISGRIYSTLGTEKLVGHVLAVIVISVLASFYPAREAAQQEPAKSLHYV
jgi:ABC-type lipoprotein release transport system permease subunit